MRTGFQRLALLGLLLSGCASSRTPVSVASFLPSARLSPPSEPSERIPLAESAAIISAQPAIDPNLKKIQELMDRVSLMFDEGERLLHKGKIVEGRQHLRNSVELIRNSPFLVPHYPFFERFFSNLKGDADGLERFLKEDQEKDASAANDKTEQILEPAAVDALPGINLYQISVDPALISLVSEDVKQMRFSIPIALNDRVFRMLEYYQNRSRSAMERGLAQSGRYMALFRKIFEEETVPLELIHAAQVESMYRPLAYSRAHAKGIWQFTRAAAQDYGLAVTPWVDERSDVEKSTRAAARYLKDLYRRFGDWQIALGAYNCGPARFERILARYGDISYWEMAERGIIPSETINHIPSVLATIIIANNPERYGFRVSYEPPVEFEKFSLRRSVLLADIAQACRVPLGVLAELNPELSRLATPRDYDYQLKLPLGASIDLIDSAADLPEAPLIRLQHYRSKKTLAGSRHAGTQKIVHRVRRGESVSSIASRYSTNVRSIRTWNRVAASLRVGQRLVIYLSK